MIRVNKSLRSIGMYFEQFVKELPVGIRTALCIFHIASLWCQK